MTLSPTTLRKLRKSLPRGYQTRTAERLKGKYTRQFVSLVARGKRQNELVLRELLAIAEEAKNAKSALEQSIAKL